MESDGAHLRQLNTDWDNVIKSVRILPGFEDFMQTKGINALKQATVSGPIIILTATDSTCFALIVTSTKEVQCIRLPELILSQVELLVDLSRGLSNPAFDFDTFTATTREHGTHSQDLLKLEARLTAGREGYINVDTDDVFRELLADLWTNIVKPVFNALNLEVSNKLLLYYIPFYVFVEIS